MPVSGVARDDRAAPFVMVSQNKQHAELERIARLIPGYDPFETAPEGYWFDHNEAAETIQFVELFCTHVKGELAGTPLLLEDWQKAFFANLFGWKRPDGTRRYRECLLFIARKNSKTTMAAAVILAVLFRDNEPGCEVYSAASERDQARLCFEIVTAMIRGQDELESMAELFKYSLTANGGSYKALSSEAGSKHGFNAHLVVNDELHAHKTPELTEVLMTSMGSRRQPLAVHMTTSDFERPNSICNQIHDHASKVRDGILEDAAFLPVIYEATIDDDWTDPVVWAKANPNLGISVKNDYMNRKCEKAKNELSFENTFKRLHLNIRTEQETRFLAMEKWDLCDGRLWALPDLNGKACFGGLDLASTSDVSALVLAFPLEDDIYAIKSFFWIPEETAVKRSKADRLAYAQWCAAGLMKATDGATCDYSVIRHDINELAKQYDIREIAVDPWNARQLQTQLREEDGWGDRVIDHRQGFISMSGPTKDLDRLVISGLLVHGGNPVLRWMASNTVVKTDPAGNLKPDKEKSAEKIDGIVALIMALGRAALRTDHTSVYETRGLLSV